MDADLESRLRSLTERLVVPTEDGGRPAELVALMPCEPVVGEVAVACWRDSEGGELVELVGLDDGRRMDDPAALREALSLLAMVETVEELASFEELPTIAGALEGWEPDPGLGADVSSLEVPRARAREAITQLAALAPTEARIARTQQLDALGAALRGLEAAWAALEQAAEAWSDELLDAHAQEPAAVATVRSLWEVLGAARRGPLARPVATALHEAREAGTSLAASLTTP